MCIRDRINCSSTNYLIKSDGVNGVCTDIIENANKNIGIGATPNDNYKMLSLIHI